MKTYKRVLTIAGSDSGGGAGIQADIKTISACGCYAASAITAITVQNTLGVHDVEPISIPTIEGQIKAVIDDIGVDAIKIGMLFDAQVVQAVHRTLAPYGIRNIVLDPVMVSTSGHRLIEQSAIACLIHDLIPIVRIITPNIPEAEILLGRAIVQQSELPEAARALGKANHVSVLLKAGHLTDDQLTDILYDNEQDKISELPSVRVHTPNTHGTGCTLSSALAAYLAQGLELQEATMAAKQYINRAIQAGSEYKIGHGFGPVAHFNQI